MDLILVIFAHIWGVWGNFFRTKHHTIPCV